MTSRVIKSIQYQITFRIKNIGRVPICNCRKDRAPHIGEYSFVLCWRCTSILSVFYLMKALSVNEIINHYWTNHTHNWLVLSFLLIVPTVIDGIRQYGFGVESTNPRRITTGLLAGIGLYLLISYSKYIIL